MSGFINYDDHCTQLTAVQDKHDELLKDYKLLEQKLAQAKEVADILLDYFDWQGYLDYDEIEKVQAYQLKEQGEIK